MGGKKHYEIRERREKVKIVVFAADGRRQMQRKIIRQDLQDCAGSLFLPASADEKHVNPVNPV
jgi:hypothetical protein